MSKSVPHALSAREILDFMARHMSHRHVKSLSEVAGLNSANVYASLAGRRPLPIETVRRLANATALQVLEGAEIRLSARPDKVLNFDVSLDDLSQLGKIIRALSEPDATAGDRAWWLVYPDWASNMGASSDTPGVYAAVIITLRRSFMAANCYAVAHINWPSLSAAKAARRKPSLLMELLEEVGPIAQPGLISVDDGRWVQLRSGFLTVREIDELCDVVTPESQPTGAAWGKLLEAVSEKGLSPNDVIGHLDLVRQQYSR